MPTDLKFKIQTEGFGQKQGTLRITDEKISFAGDFIEIGEIYSISTSLKRTTEVLYSTINAEIVLKSVSRNLKLSFSSSNFLGMGKMDRVLHNYLQIRDVVLQVVGPPILEGLVSNIFQGGTIKIANLAFNLRGVTGRKIFGFDLCAPWEAPPEIRHISNKSLIPNVLRGDYEIFFHNKVTGEIITLGSYSSDDENGLLVAQLISAIIKIRRES